MARPAPPPEPDIYVIVVDEAGVAVVLTSSYEAELVAGIPPEMSSGYDLMTDAGVPREKAATLVGDMYARQQRTGDSVEAQVRHFLKLRRVLVDSTL